MREAERRVRARAALRCGVQQVVLPRGVSFCGVSKRRRRVIWPPFRGAGGGRNLEDGRIGGRRGGWLLGSVGAVGVGPPVQKEEEEIAASRWGVVFFSRDRDGDRRAGSEVRARPCCARALGREWIDHFFFHVSPLYRGSFEL